MRNAKLHDLQNRLGFVTTLAARFGASELGASQAANSPQGSPSTGEPRARRLKEFAAVLDRSRLVKEDTLCHESLTPAERSWLRANRSKEAAHWNLLTDMRIEHLAHGRN